MNDYIMVTPAKNEEAFIQKVIDSVVMSSSVPKLWVIVNDSSTDKTLNILAENSKKYDFIKILSLTEDHERDLTFHYSFVCKRGFEYVLKLAEEQNIDWEYIFLLDADTILERNYIEGLINEMNCNLNLGIASGNVHILKSGNIDSEYLLNDIPFGTARVWRKKCFFETGGYQITQAPDAVSMVKARLRGWKTFRFDNYTAYQLRYTSSAQGLFIGYATRGKTVYYLNKNPLLVLMHAVQFSIEKPHYTSIFFLYGYFLSVFKNERKIDDDEIRHYFYVTRLRELYSLLISKISCMSLSEK